jgi:head-tail adaptor
MRAGDLRHVVTVMRPTLATGTLGQTQGNPLTIYEQWPCSMKTIGGSESVQGQQVSGSRTLEIEGYTDPRKPIVERDYLKFGSRTLHVSFVDDIDQNGTKVRLVCGENL